MKNVLGVLVAGAIGATTFAVSCKREVYCELCTNRPPIAIAGPDREISLPTDTVWLNGAASTDPDGRLVKWEWIKVKGPELYQIEQKNAPGTMVTQLAEGVYQFMLIVTDNQGGSKSDIVQVVVHAKETGLPFLGDIYVSGQENSSAVYWKNGEKVVLRSGGGPEAMASAITIDGTDVYVAGSEGDFFQYGKNRAKYWKNGEEVYLTGATGAGVSGIVVHQGDVYVSGWHLKGAHAAAVYWKNGEEFWLTDGTTEAEATGLTISNGDLYVVGQENGIAKYWKNGQAVSLTHTIGTADAYAIKVVGNDVYVAGTEFVAGVAIAKYWKNGQGVNLSGDSQYNTHIAALDVVGSDVYVAGYSGNNGNYKPRLWKTGQEVITFDADIFAMISGMKVVGELVFVVGTQKIADMYIATRWKNGKSISLASSGSLATGMAVVMQ